MITYPNIDPVLLKLGPLHVRWYSLAYIFGIILGVWLFKKDFKTRLRFNSDNTSNLMTFMMIGILLGGRLGYVIFYDFHYYIGHPGHILAFWQGGMSFHGGAIGVVISLMLFSHRYQKNIWDLLDLLAIGATPGIFLGRIANFINGELYGRTTTVPWGMVFPNGGDLPRHPSQLYEAFLEGFLLFIILYFFLRKTDLNRGQLFSAFLILYGSFRFFLEFLREPDAQVGYLFGWMTMGQILSFVMVALGVGLFIKHRNRVV